MCRHKDCSDNPYLGDLPTCGSHIRRIQLGVCLMCPYCPNKCFYNSRGWRDHMNKKHPSVPWYRAPTTEESVQAQAMLDALSTDPSAHIGSLEDTSSTPSSAAPTKASTPTCSEQIQSLIKEIPTNVQFPQAQQPKSKKMVWWCFYFIRQCHLHIQDACPADHRIGQIFRSSFANTSPTPSARGGTM